MLRQDFYSQGIDGNILGCCKNIVNDNEGRQQLDVGGIVKENHDPQRTYHCCLRSGNPGPLGPKSLKFYEIYQRRPGPFQSPGGIKGGGEEADLSQTNTTHSQMSGQGNGGKAKGNTFG